MQDTDIPIPKEQSNIEDYRHRILRKRRLDKEEDSGFPKRNGTRQFTSCRIYRISGQDYLWTANEEFIEKENLKIIDEGLLLESMEAKDAAAPPRRHLQKTLVLRDIRCVYSDGEEPIWMSGVGGDPDDYVLSYEQGKLLDFR